MYRALYSRVLTHTDPEEAHEAAIAAIARAGTTEAIRRALKATYGRREQPVHSERLLQLPRPVPGVLGLAAGMDKNGVAILGMDALGFGYVEVGTVTAIPQPGNDKPRLWREPSLCAFRNRMGFNNDGAAALGHRLRELRRTVAGRGVVVGVNIGKSKVVPLKDAAADYEASTREVAQWADYITINVSSPNTPGLRELQDVDSLRPILRVVRETASQRAGRDVPVFVKIAPDLTDAEITDIARMVVEENSAGICAVNTTIHHDLGPGGLSGAPLKERAREVVALLRHELGLGQIIIGVGGIETPQDGRALLDAGADLLQAFTAFVYEGPSWPGRMNRALSD